MFQKFYQYSKVEAKIILHNRSTIENKTQAEIHGENLKYEMRQHTLLFQAKVHTVNLRVGKKLWKSLRLKHYCITSIKIQFGTMVSVRLATENEVILNYLVGHRNS